MLSEKLDSYLSVEVEMGSSCDKGIMCINICVCMCICMCYYGKKPFKIQC